MEFDWFWFTIVIGIICVSCFPHRAYKNQYNLNVITMEVKNGIIIDGVLHELKETKRNDCLKCSLRDLCQSEFGNECLCWIDLASESWTRNNEFKCRGKVTDIKIDKEE